MPLVASWTRTTVRRPPLTTPSCSAGTPPLVPGAGLGRGGLPARHRPAGTDVSAARHDRASWEVKLLVGHRERLVAEHIPGQATGWAGSCTQPDPTKNRRPAGNPAQASASTAWLAQAAQEASRSPLSARRAPDRRDWRPDRPARPRALPSCHPVGPEPAAWLGGRTLTTAKPSSSPRPPPWPGPRQLRQHRSPAPVADGSRQPHAALHRIAITQLRLPGPHQTYDQRRRA
jgi:transposase